MTKRRRTPIGLMRVGRKEAVHVRILASQFTEEAINTLVTIMRDPEEKAIARLLAANAILDRGWGKPSQPIEHVVEEMSDEELRQRVNMIMNQQETRPMFPEPEPEVIDAKLEKT